MIDKRENDESTGIKCIGIASAILPNLSPKINRQDIPIHVVHCTIIMAIHASNRDEIVAFSHQNAVLHYQLLTHVESLSTQKR